mmetsp:Transcript_37214/g.98482  ORF Transcript_37214/g.98482 Transcript_37214/m.98482 type:complete len:217 (+) Transcript_37214:585-1235(+)
MLPWARSCWICKACAFCGEEVAAPSAAQPVGCAMRIVAVPAATDAGSGCNSHLVSSSLKLTISGNGRVLICLLKSVGGGGSSSKPRSPPELVGTWGDGASKPPRRSVGPAGAPGGGDGLSSNPRRSSAGGAGLLGATVRLGAPLSSGGGGDLSSLPLARPSPSLSSLRFLSFPSSSTLSSLARRFSCWARRLAFSLCTLLTVVGMRTPSSGTSDLS